MDSGYLENRVQTINELLRKSTFRESSDASKPFSQRKGNLTVHGKPYSFVHRVHGASFDPLRRFPDLNHVHFLCWVDNIYWSPGESSCAYVEIRPPDALRPGRPRSPRSAVLRMVAPVANQVFTLASRPNVTTDCRYLGGSKYLFSDFPFWVMSRRGLPTSVGPYQGSSKVHPHASPGGTLAPSAYIGSSPRLGETHVP